MESEHQCPRCGRTESSEIDARMELNRIDSGAVEVEGMGRLGFTEAVSHAAVKIPAAVRDRKQNLEKQLRDYADCTHPQHLGKIITQADLDAAKEAAKPKGTGRRQTIKDAPDNHPVKDEEGDGEEKDELGPEQHRPQKEEPSKDPEPEKELKKPRAPRKPKDKPAEPEEKPDESTPEGSDEPKDEDFQAGENTMGARLADEEEKPE